MQNLLVRVVIIYVFSFFFGEIPISEAGFDRFTVIDSLGKWRIEQKFDSKTKQIFCRAFLKGNGTWFAEKIRINQNDEFMVPEGVLFRDIPSLDDVREIKSLLQECRKGLLYIPS